MNWQGIIELVWKGYTVPDSYAACGYTKDQERASLIKDPDMKDLLLEIAMLAEHVKEEIDARYIDSNGIH